jgi:hypothetical protein
VAITGRRDFETEVAEFRSGRLYDLLDHHTRWTIVLSTFREQAVLTHEAVDRLQPDMALLRWSA